uniref:Uncharacterized protein n=1 Tax=Oryza glumipatula TaxID=40148 RepID=A0A0E0AAD3_9ORYZ
MRIGERALRLDVVMNSRRQQRLSIWQHAATALYRPSNPGHAFIVGPSHSLSCLLAARHRIVALKAPWWLPLPPESYPGLPLHR